MIEAARLEIDPERQIQLWVQAQIRILDDMVAFLEDNPDIMNLRSWIRGIPRFVEKQTSDICAFTDAPVLTTRTTIMEDGDMHLCFGNPIGNLFHQSMEKQHI